MKKTYTIKADIYEREWWVIKVKKKAKFIYFISLVLTIILTISIIVIYQNIKMSKMLHTTAIITDISEREGVCTIFIKKSKEDTEPNYVLTILSNENDLIAKNTKNNIDNPIVKNIKGKRVNVTSLDIGDTIYIIYEKHEGLKKSVYTKPPYLENIKLIKVIDKNVNE